MAARLDHRNCAGPISDLGASGEVSNARKRLEYTLPRGGVLNKEPEAEAPGRCASREEKHHSRRDAGKRTESPLRKRLGGAGSAVSMPAPGGTEIARVPLLDARAAGRSSPDVQYGRAAGQRIASAYACSRGSTERNLL